MAGHTASAVQWAGPRQPRRTARESRHHTAAEVVEQAVCVHTRPPHAKCGGISADHSAAQRPARCTTTVLQRRAVRAAHELTDSSGTAARLSPRCVAHARAAPHVARVCMLPAARDTGWRRDGNHSAARKRMPSLPRPRSPCVRHVCGVCGVRAARAVRAACAARAAGASARTAQRVCAVCDRAVRVCESERYICITNVVT